MCIYIYTYIYTYTYIYIYIFNIKIYLQKLEKNYVEKSLFKNKNLSLLSYGSYNL